MELHVIAFLFLLPLIPRSTSEAALQNTLASVFLESRNVSCNLAAFRQQQFCLRRSWVQPVLDNAVVLAETHCQHCFPTNARVCPTPTRATFSKMTRDTAMMYALYAASLAYSAAERFSHNNPSRRCITPHNIHSGVHFTRVLLLIDKPLHPERESDPTQKHNFMIGLRVVKSSVRERCVRAGIKRSGQIQKRFCYKELKPFTDIALTLQSLYATAVYLKQQNKTRAKKKRKFPKRLWYTDESSPECSPAGSRCYHRTHCYQRCCSEDFNIQRSVTQYYCHCYFEFGFKLDCEICNKTLTTHFCN